MPPTRRARTASGPKTAQSTLSFGGAGSRVTKASAAAVGKDGSKKRKSSNLGDSEVLQDGIKKADIELELELGSSGVDDDDSATAAVEPSITSAAVVVQEAKLELRKPRTKEESEAERVSDAQIKRYWRQREAERIAPRVHQKALSTEEKILRLFDMSSQYGPSIGIARMKRWQRAHKLCLSPPLEVLAVLLKEERKGNSAIERAHVDELMSSKFVVGEA